MTDCSETKKRKNAELNSVMGEEFLLVLKGKVWVQEVAMVGQHWEFT